MQSILLFGHGISNWCVHNALQVAILEYKSIICAGYSAVMHIHTCAEEVSIKVFLLTAHRCSDIIITCCATFSHASCISVWTCACVLYIMHNTPCSKKVVHQAHIDNLVNSQRIFKMNHMSASARIVQKGLGVECHRRSNRGAEGMWHGDGTLSVPLWRTQCPLPQKF